MKRGRALGCLIGLHSWKTIFRPWHNGFWLELGRCCRHCRKRRR